MGQVRPRKFLVAAGVLIATPFASKAPQQPTKVWRIGLLHAGSAPDPNFDAFRRELSEFGFVDGQNLVIEDRWAEGKPDRLPDLAVDLVALKVDILLAGALHPLGHSNKRLPPFPSLWR